MTQAAANAHAAQPATDLCCPIVELRQYTLYPGTRDDFIALFDRELVETQETTGMRAIGQFRDLGDPNRFVWIRGFSDMPSREKALTAFYMQSETWRRFGEAARSKMIDSSDALLLRPIRPECAFALASAESRPPIEAQVPKGLVVATIYQLPRPVDSGFLEFFEAVILPLLASSGARVLGLLATEYSLNNFPRLPLREGEHVFMTVLGFGELAAYHAHMTALGQNPRWRDELYPDLVRRLQTRPQILRLAPTSRSQLRG